MFKILLLSKILYTYLKQMLMLHWFMQTFKFCLSFFLSSSYPFYKLLQEDSQLILVESVSTHGKLVALMSIFWTPWKCPPSQVNGSVLKTCLLPVGGGFLFISVCDLPECGQHSYSNRAMKYNLSWSCGDHVRSAWLWGSSFLRSSSRVSKEQDVFEEKWSP